MTQRPTGSRGRKGRFRSRCLCHADEDEEEEPAKVVGTKLGAGMTARNPKDAITGKNVSVIVETSGMPSPEVEKNIPPTEEAMARRREAATHEHAETHTEEHSKEEPSLGVFPKSNDGGDSIPRPTPEPTLSQEQLLSLDDERSLLWQEAYSKLGEENPTLIDCYESVIKDSASIDQSYLLCDQISVVAAAQKLKVENKQWKFQWFGEKKSVRDSVESILDLTNRWAGVVSVGMSHAPPYVSIPWSATTALIPLMMNEIKEHRGCINGLEAVMKITFSYQMAERTFLGRQETRELYKKCVLELYTKILQYQALAIRYFGKPTLRRLGKNITGSTTWDDTSASLRSLDGETRGNLQLLGQEYQISTLERITELLQRQEHDGQTHLRRLARQRYEVEDIMERISPISFEKDHVEVRRTLGESHFASGRWYLEDPGVMAWRSWAEGNRCIWLKGSVGTGKSSLTSILVEDLVRKPGGVIAFSYCSRDFDDVDKKSMARNNHENLLRSILSQVSLSVDGTSVHPSIKKCYDGASRQGLSSLSDTECVELLDEVFSTDPKARFTIVVDALDECKDYYSLLKSLHEATSGNDNVRLALSSRLQVQVDHNDYFPKATSVTIMSHNNDDIRRYLEIEIPRRRPGCGITDCQIKRLTKLLTERASGMFMWVKLQLNRLMDEVRHRRIKREDDIESKLASLEASEQRDLDLLYEAYNGVYDEAIGFGNQDNRQHVVDTALRWVLCSFRTLTLQELTYATSIRENGEVDGNVREGTVIEYCSNLIREDSWGTIRLSHLSVRHYLEDRKPLVVRTELSHLQAALSCLYFANSPRYHEIGSSVCEVLEVRNVVVTKGFHAYVTEYWPIHCRLASKTGELQVLVDKFAGPSLLRSRRARTLSVGPDGADTEAPLGNREDEEAASVVTAVSLMCDFISALSKDDKTKNLYNQFDERDSDKHEGGNTFIAQYVASGADLDIQDHLGTTLLHLAMRFSQSVVAKILLNAGAQPDVQDRTGSTPLHLAAMHRFDGGVRQLLLRGTNKDVRNHRGETPLHLAVLSNATDVAETLLSANADALALDQQDNTPLHLAAAMGNELMVETLLLKGYSPNGRNQDGDSALSIAIRLESADIMRLLLKNHATVTEHEKLLAMSLESPTIAAAIARHESAEPQQWLPSGAPPEKAEAQEEDEHTYDVEFPDSEDGCQLCCKACDVSRWFLASRGGMTFKHHPSIDHLYESAKSCFLCRFFKRKIEEKLPRSTPWPTGELTITVDPSTTQCSKMNRKDELILSAGETTLLSYEICSDLDIHAESTHALDWVTGRAVRNAPTAESYQEILESWMTECDDSHPSCSPLADPPLPTHVIDVGSAADGTVRLVKGSGEVGKFLYLSISWGSISQINAQMDNADTLLRGISLYELPKTWQSAVWITRYLGLRYLWIDRMCIGYDPRGDWKLEYSLVDKYLRDAALVLVATVSSDSSSSLFVARQKPLLTIDINERTASYGISVGRVRRTRVHLRQPLDTPAEALRQNVLSEAWRIQDVVLPRRLLIIGPEQLYWHCRAHLRSEGSTVVQKPFLELQPRGSTPTVRRGAGGPAYRSWYNFVETYSPSKSYLSYQRLEAIEASAQYFESGSGYAVGLWAQDMRSGLLWYVDNVLDGSGWDDYTAPSWSWAAAPGQVWYTLLAGCQHEYTPRDAALSILGVTEDGAVPSHHVSRPDEPRWLLEISAMTITSTATELDRSRCVCLFDHWTGEIGWREGRPFLLVFFSPWGIPGKGGRGSRAVGLVLSNDGKRQRPWVEELGLDYERDYYRVGLFWMASYDDHFKGWTRRNLRIF